jgi:hypothetical protein
MAGGWMVLLFIILSAWIVYLGMNRLIALGEKIDLHRLRKKDERQFIIRCYREIEKTLARKKNLPRPAFHAPSEYRPMVAANLPHLGRSFGIMTRLFNIARYSTLPIGSAEADLVFQAYQDILEGIDINEEK